MGSVIDVGFKLDWEQPVFVDDGELCYKVISGPRAGLRYLQENLPLRSGQTYWNAVSACSSALLHRSDPDKARTSFIAAYAECMTKTAH
jgi:hypothetical protein